jgi:hypothetical protein
VLILCTQALADLIEEAEEIFDAAVALISLRGKGDVVDQLQVGPLGLLQKTPKDRLYRHLSGADYFATEVKVVVLE